MEDRIRALFQSIPIERDGRVLVQSKCTVCGFTVVGSVAEGLLDQQEAHVRTAHSGGGATGS